MHTFHFTENISKALCLEEFKNDSLREVQVSGLDLKQEFCLIHHKDKIISPLIEKFIQLCINYKGDSGNEL